MLTVVLIGKEVFVAATAKEVEEDIGLLAKDNVHVLEDTQGIRSVQFVTVVSLVIEDIEEEFKQTPLFATLVVSLNEGEVTTSEEIVREIEGFKCSALLPTVV